MKLIGLFLLAGLLIATSGCGKSGDNKPSANDQVLNKYGKPGPGAGASCYIDAETTFLCVEQFAAQDQDFAKACGENKGTFSTQTCTQDKFIGTCRIPQRNNITLVLRLYQPLTAAQAQGACMQKNGQFSTAY